MKNTLELKTKDRGTKAPEIAPKPPRIDNTEAVELFRAEGGNIVHCHPTRNRRGVTFAYKVRSGHIEFATAVQHRNDTFTKRIGTKTAIEHFNAGKTVNLPYGNSDDAPAAFLRFLNI